MGSLRLHGDVTRHAFAEFHNLRPTRFIKQINFFYFSLADAISPPLSFPIVPALQAFAKLFDYTLLTGMPQGEFVLISPKQRKHALFSSQKLKPIILLLFSPSGEGKADSWQQPSRPTIPTHSWIFIIQRLLIHLRSMTMTVAFERRFRYKIRLPHSKRPN